MSEPALTMPESLTVGGLDIALNKLVQWERFAHHLPGITPTDVEIIKKDKRDDTVEQKQALYKVWLERYPRGTWEDIVGSLEKAKYNSLAEELKKKYTIIKTALQERVKEIRVQKHIVDELDKLQQTFISLELDVEKGINEAVKCGKMSVSQLVNRTTKERAFTIPQLQTVQTTNDYFNAIRPHYTFLNCHLLVCLALMLLDPIRAAANEYQRKVDALKKNTAIKHFKDTLQRYSSMLPPCKSDTMMPVAIVLEDTWGREKIWLVEELIKKLFDLRHPDECQWFRVFPGSVVVVFLAPEHMMMSIIVNVSKRRGLMRLLGVESISVGECTILGGYQEITPFDLFTSLLHDVQNGCDTTELLLKNATNDLNQTISIKNLTQTCLNPRFEILQLANDRFDSLTSEFSRKLSLIIPELESEVSSGRLTLESLVSCVNESMVCPIEGLADVQSVHELFQVIQPYYTFLNNHIIQQLALQLSGRDAHTAYNMFLSVNMMKTGIIQLSEIIKPLQKHLGENSVSPIMMKVIFTLHDTWQTAKMDAVEQLIQFLFNLKHPDELLWHRVRYGSVIIEFLAPKNMMMHLITNSVKQKQLMTLTGVMRLQIGNIVVHKSTQQLTLAESREKSKFFLQNSKALAIYEAYVKSIPSKKLSMDENNNFNFQDSSTLTGAYLMLACIYSDSSLVKLLLECGADPNSHDSEGQTALMWASLNGNIRQIELLLSYGANIDEQRVNGYTPLMMAALTGNKRLMKFLVTANADLYCTETTRGLTAIHIAAQWGHKQVVEILLDAKVDVNLCDAVNKRTCLHEAISDNNFDTVQLLLKRNANINAQDKLGLTPLSIAADTDNLQLLDELVRANADIEITTHDLEMTPLHIASNHGFVRIVKRLLEANANKNARDKLFQTPLFKAAVQNHTKVMRALIEAGADPNSEDMGQLPPIVCLSNHGNVEIIELLLEKGADLYGHYSDGSNSLHAACQSGHLDIVNILLKAGINPDTLRDDGTSPFYLACFYGKQNIVKRLLKEGVNVNAKTKNGITPIHAATAAEHVAIVKILLRAGADPSIADIRGMTPYHRALQLNNARLITLLRKK